MKKSLIAISAGLLVLSASAAPVSARTLAQENSNISSIQNRPMISFGETDQDQKLLAGAVAINEYIAIGSDGFLHIAEEGKTKVSSEVYRVIERGVNTINAEIQSGALIVNGNTATLGRIAPMIEAPGPGEFTTNAFSNAYWWGVAITFNDQETKNQIYTLTQTGVIWGLVATVAGVSGAHAATIAAALVSAGAFMIANSMSAHNMGKGVTLNIHWLPAPYFESTTNR